MDLSVRRIQPDDGAVLRTIRLRALAGAPHAFSMTLDEGLVRTDDEWAEAAARRATGDQEAMFFAETAAGVVGMVGVLVDGDPAGGDRAEMVAMWTDPAARRHGVGRLLVETATAWARDVGFGVLHAGVATGNDDARRLYLAAGFIPTGEVRPLRGEEARTEERLVRTLADPGPPPA